MSSNRHFAVILLSLLSFSLASCADQRTPTSQATAEPVVDSVRQMMTTISTDISNNGPVAWLKYFEDSPSFFMASDGNIAFKNSDSAKSFIQNILVRQIRKITLDWTNVRVDSLSINLASIGAKWHEVITTTSNTSTTYAGYFTSLAKKTSSGWRLRNLHWSISK